MESTALARQTFPRAPAEHEIWEIAQRHAAAYTELLESILTNVGPDSATLENTVFAIARLENAQSGERAMIKALKYCSPVLNIQKECEKAEALWREAGSDRRAGMYPLIAAARAASSEPQAQLSRLADKMLSDLHDLGFSDMRGDAAKELRDNKEGIKQRSVQFLRNLREEDRSIEATAEEMDGVLDQLKNTKLIETEGQPAKLCVPYTGNYNSIMRRAHNADVRKKMYEIHSTRYIENVSLFKEILLLRDKNSRLLGYNNHAELRLRDRLPPSITAVNELLTSTLNALQQHRQATTQDQPGKPKASQNKTEVITTAPWDKLYNKAKLLQNKSKGDVASEFAAYFPLWHTFRRMTWLAEDIFGLRFEPIPADSLLAASWHSDIKGWAVWEGEQEGGGGFVGYFLADLQNRPHKYKGNQSVNLMPVGTSSLLLPHASNIHSSRDIQKMTRRGSIQQTCSCAVLSPRRRIMATCSSTAISGLCSMASAHVITLTMPG